MSCVNLWLVIHCQKEAEANRPNVEENRRNTATISKHDSPPTDITEQSISQFLYEDLGEEPIPKGKVPDEVSAHHQLQEWEKQIPKVPSAYKPSGNLPTSAYVAMSIAVPVAATAAAFSVFVASIILSIGLHIIVYLPDRLLKMIHIAQDGGAWDKTIAVIGTCLVSMFAGVAGGLAAGWIVARAGKFGRNRSSSVAATYSVVSYLAMIAFIIVLVVTGQGRERLESAIGSQWLLIISALLTTVFGSLVSILAGVSTAISEPFCEMCGVFMIERNVPSLSYRASRHAILPIKDGNISEFVRRLKSETGHRGVPRVHVCPKCGAGFAELTIQFSAEWSEKNMLERQEKKYLSSSWLAASVPLKEAESQLLP